MHTMYLLNKLMQLLRLDIPIRLITGCLIVLASIL